MPPEFLNEEETLAGLIGLVALGVVLYCFLAGPRRRPSAIPASVEGRIDHVVGALNARFGKDWGGVDVDVLSAELRRDLPSALLSLVDVVHLIEEHAPERGLSSSTKRWWAAHQVSRVG